MLNDVMDVLWGKVQVLLETDDLFVLEKPSGIPSSSLLSSNKISMVDKAVVLCPALKHLGKEHEYGLLHRLDEGTSGCLVFAKNLQQKHLLRELWKTFLVQKSYAAIVKADTSLPLGLLQTWMAHSKKTKKKMLYTAFNTQEKLYSAMRGKLLLAKSTIYSDVAHLEMYREVQLYIHTGWRHQIRCQLKALGVTIVGDRLYGGEPYDRLCLHAHSVTLVDRAGKSWKVEASSVFKEKEVS